MIGWRSDTRTLLSNLRPAAVAALMTAIMAVLPVLPAVASDETGRKALEESDRKREGHRGYLLGVYGELLGIYDDVLNETTEGPRTLQRLLHAPDWLRLSLQHRTRYETLDNRWRAGEQGSDQQIAQRTRLLIGIRDILDPFRAVIELQDSRVQATDAGSFVDNTHVNHVDVQQAHLDLAFRNFLGSGLPSLFAVGRLNLDIGSGRWIGRNVFRNTTNAFDGAQWRLGDPDHDLTVRAFLVRPVQRFMTTLDPWLREQRNTLWGLYAESRHFQSLNLSLYYFGHSSESSATSERSRREFSMIGTRLWKNGKPGEFEYEVESAYQTGVTGRSNGFAHFQHGEAGYTWDAPWRPQFLARFDYASAGLDELYGRRNFELIATGIFGPFERTNLVSPGWRFLVLPREDLYVFVQHRGWWLADATASWAESGLRDPTGGSGRYLGQTVELRARWGATDNLFLQAGYVHFDYGSFIHRVPGGPTGDHADYGYISAEWIF
jgi:ribosome modulation factor